MDLYEVLGVSRNSEPEVINASYRALMKKYHPDTWMGDKGEAEQRSRRINEAYFVLKDEQRRLEYDEAQRRKQLTEESEAIGRQTPGAARRPLRDGKPREFFGFTTGALFLSLLVTLGWGLLRQGRSEASSVSAPALVGTVPSSAPAMAEPHHFCVTNKTSQVVSYTVAWGSRPARRLTLEPNDYHLHQSTRGFGAVIRWQSGREAEELLVDARDMPVSVGVCLANYVFAYKDLRVTAFVPSPEDSFGLYRAAE